MWQRAGLSTAEINGLLADRRRRHVWQQMVRAKLRDLQRQEEEIHQVRQQLEHALLCRAPDWTTCRWIRTAARSR